MYPVYITVLLLVTCIELMCVSHVYHNAASNNMLEFVCIVHVYHRDASTNAHIVHVKITCACSFDLWDGLGLCTEE